LFRSRPDGRFLILAPQPFYQDRGTPIAVRRVLEALSQQGCRVDLLTYPAGEEVDLPGLRIFRTGTWLPIYDVPIGFSFRKILLDLFLFAQTIRLTRREAYRCIHAVEEAGLLALLLRRWHRLPIVYDMQSSLPEHLAEYAFFRIPRVQRLLRFIERWLIRNVDRIVCSAGLKEHVVGIHPAARVSEWFFPGEWADVPNEAVDRLRKDLRISAGSRVVLYAGNFAPYQGLSKLIEAVPKVLSKEPDAVFVLVGMNGACEFDLKEKVEALRDRGALKLIPRQPKSEMDRFLALADVVVSARDSGSNVGLKVFSYMAAGKPIVATDSPGHRTLLDAERAMLVDSSPDGLVEGIVRLLQDRTTAERLGSAARAYARKHLHWDRFVKQVADLYDLENGR
jgi:glycosyltransferase involved in cell wall biosynthesis